MAIIETPSTLTSLERFVEVLREGDKRRAHKLSYLGGILYMELLRFVKEHPEVKIKTDTDFANYVHVPKDLLSRYLTGNRIPDPETIEHMCDRLRCSYNRKVFVMALIQQTPKHHRQVAEQKLNQELSLFVNSLTTSTLSLGNILSLAENTSLPEITEFSPLLWEEVEKIPLTTEPFSSVQTLKQETPSLRENTLSTVRFPSKRVRSTTAEIEDDA